MRVRMNWVFSVFTVPSRKVDKTMSPENVAWWEKEGREELLCPDFLNPALAVVDGALQVVVKPGTWSIFKSSPAVEVPCRQIQISLLLISHKILEFSVPQCPHL